MLPAHPRNALWRASLVIDNVIWCDASKLEDAIPQWRPRSFRDHAADVLD
jgi:hypothetical protein